MSLGGKNGRKRFFGYLYGFRRKSSREMEMGVIGEQANEQQMRWGKSGKVASFRDKRQPVLEKEIMNHGYNLKKEKIIT